MRATFLGLVAATLLPCLAAAEEKPARPNVVFILADDLGVNDLGCYGRKDHRTPNLDRLAREGVRFTAAYAAQSVCSPTRAALMTGKAPARLHLTTFLPGRPDCDSQKLLHPKINPQLPLSEKTLAEHLKAAGYATACVGKWHLGSKGFLPTDQGFDLYHAGQANTKPSESEGGKGEYNLTAKAIQFIEDNRDRPFFLYLPHNNPHIPYAAQEGRMKANASAFEPAYAAVIETLDDAVGRVLAKLDELKLTEKTLVVFTSDNGGLHVPEGPHDRVTHNTPCRAGKGYLYEGGIRVPQIVRWPGRVPAGKEIDTPVVTTDWLPTLLEFVGEKPPSGLDGVSLSPLLAGKGRLEERALFWHLPHYTNQGGRPSGAARLGRWKLVEQYEDDSAELFDLVNDPGETKDLSAAESKRATELRGRLAAWLKQTEAQRNEPNPKFDAALHRPLYVELDPSRYDPTKAEQLDRMKAWRKAMNAALPTRR
jgi:arylsulfatase A